MNQRTDEPTNQPTDQRTNQPTNQPTNRQKTCPLKPSHIFPLLDLLIFASLLAFSQICFSRSLRYSLTHLSMCIAEHRCWKLKLALRILEATILVVGWALRRRVALHHNTRSFSTDDRGAEASDLKHRQRLRHSHLLHVKSTRLTRDPVNGIRLTRLFTYDGAGFAYVRSRSLIKG